MAKYTVVFDACVLYPFTLRSYLMHLSNTGLFRARWTDKIHEEWIQNLLINRPDISREQLQQTRNLMNSHVPHCLIEGYESFVNGLELPDENDRHIVAAAIKAQADSIITFNLDDFPDDVLENCNLVAIHPDEFLEDMFYIERSVCIRAAQKHRSSLKKRPLTTSEYLMHMRTQKLPKFVNCLRQYESLI